jgi:hypothetical protein
VGQFRSAGGFVLLSGRKLGPWISCRSRHVTTDRSGLDVRLTKVWCSDATPLRHPGSSEIFADREAVRAKPPSIYLPVDLTWRALMLTLEWMRVLGAFLAFRRLLPRYVPRVGDSEIWRLINHWNVVHSEFGKTTVGLKILNISAEREAAALSCDCQAHGGSPRTAWFDCGSRFGNLCLAKAAGWAEGRSGVWICPQCAQRNPPKQNGRRKGTSEGPRNAPRIAAGASE